MSGRHENNESLGTIKHTRLRLVGGDAPDQEPKVTGDREPGVIDAALENQLAVIQGDPAEAVLNFADCGGFSGQRGQLFTVTLACVSAAANRPVNVLCVGDPGDGKSTVAKAATEITGPCFAANSGTIQRVTNAALARMGAEITGRAIVLDERLRKNDQFAAAIRGAASGHKVTQFISQRGEAIPLTIEPPVAIVDLCLTDETMSLQDRSRYLRIRMGTDEATRNAITEASLSRFTLEGNRNADNLRQFARAFQLCLAGLDRDLTVVVPFAPRVQIPTQSPLRDRLLTNYLNAVCTVAWLRQSARITHTDDTVGKYIEATVDDYRLVHDIVAPICDDGSNGELPDNPLQLLRLWQRWMNDNGNGGLARDQFTAVTGDALSQSQTYRALIKLFDAGYAAGPRGRGHIGRWRLTDLGLRASHPNLFSLLPTPDELAARVQNCKSGQ